MQLGPERHLTNPQALHVAHSSFHVRMPSNRLVLRGRMAGRNRITCLGNRKAELHVSPVDSRSELGVAAPKYRLVVQRLLAID